MASNGIATSLNVATSFILGACDGGAVRKMKLIAQYAASWAVRAVSTALGAKNLVIIRTLRGVKFIAKFMVLSLLQKTPKLPKHPVRLLQNDDQILAKIPG